MKSYWIYLDSYVFVFKKLKYTLFYNSLSGHRFIIKNNKIINRLVKKIIAPQNMYCVKISQYQLEIYEINSFLQLLRANFMGDIIEIIDNIMKPAILFPKPKIMNSIQTKENDANIGMDIMKYMHRLSIQITDHCQYNCKYCMSIFKQCISCSKKNNNELPFRIVQLLFDSVIHTPISCIDIIGGNIFSHNEYDRIARMITQFKNTSINIIINYNQFNSTDIFDKINVFSYCSNIKMKIQITKIVNQNEFEKINKNIIENKIQHEYELIIYNENQMNILETICGKLKIENYSLKPYLKQNSDIIKYLSFSEEDIFKKLHTKKDIFRRQILNNNFFGNIYVSAEGQAYASINKSPLGSIYEFSLSDLIKKELKNGDSWFLKRDKEPCSKCIYQWICPSISNYELSINKINLCDIKMNSIKHNC